MQIVRRDHGVIGGEKIAKLMGSAELWDSEAAPLALCTTPGLVSFAVHRRHGVVCRQESESR